MIPLSIDHGSTNGAAALVRVATRVEALAVVTWGDPTKARKDGSRKRREVRLWRAGHPVVGEDVPGGMTRQHRALVRMADLLTALDVVPDLIAVEGTTHHGPSPASLVGILETAGRAVQWVATTYDVEPLRPHANQWRPVVGVTTSDAKKAAREACALVGGPPVPGLPVRVHGLPPELAAIDHVADACLIGEAVVRLAALTRKTRRSA